MEAAERHEFFMEEAMAEARKALAEQEVPIGCVIVRGDAIVARGRNMTNHSRNATRHAEFEAIDALLSACGGEAKAAAFTECELYVTCEPCIMCAGALSLLGFKSMYFGCNNDRFGGCGSILRIHERGCGPCTREGGMSVGLQPSLHGGSFRAVGGLRAADAVALLQEFYVTGNPRAPVPHRPVTCALPPGTGHNSEPAGPRASQRTA